MPQSLNEVLKDKTIFERLNGKKPAEKFKELVILAVDLTRGVLFERSIDSSEIKSRKQFSPKK